MERLQRDRKSLEKELERVRGGEGRGGEGRRREGEHLHRTASLDLQLQC